jgi:hypothetical protein
MYTVRLLLLLVVGAATPLLFGFAGIVLPLVEFVEGIDDIMCMFVVCDLRPAFVFLLNLLISMPLIEENSKEATTPGDLWTSDCGNIPQKYPLHRLSAQNRRHIFQTGCSFA